ncbi:uncharacterized protein BKA78DRAFT_26070 [Phyllosticta capitalensis]|uniref:Glycosyltransferase 2-like domain-containing protein n=1 Tax=Phyllosticta capitalensis TaxID=121624 RepID=A0ABR1YJE6_9PEZI
MQALHLLLINLVVITIVLSLAQSRRRQPISLPGTIDESAVAEDGSRYWVIPETLAMALSFPLSMQALLHWTNLSTFTMMPLFSYLSYEVFGLVVNLKQGLRWTKAIQVTGLACSSLLIVFDEYRLTPENILCAFFATFLAGLSLGCKRMRPSTLNPSSNPPSVRLEAMFVSIVCAAGWCIWKEDPVAAITNFKIVDLWMLTLNVGSTTAAVLTGGSFIFPLSTDDHSEINVATTQAAKISANFAMTTIVGFISTFLPIRSYATVLQLCCYCAATICLLSTPQVEDDRSAKTEGFGLESFFKRRAQKSGFAVDDDEALSEISLVSEAEPSRSRILPSLVSLAAYAVLLVTWIGFLACNFGPLPDSNTRAPVTLLDPSYSAPHGFDVVISMYKEPVEAVRAIMSELSEIPLANASAPRLHLYTKDETAQVDQLKEATNAFQVTKLPNHGREGDTYLQHILREWDSLGRHTLFLQADVHNSREIFDRIRDFYVPETGMLSLGFTGKLCETENCGDRWGWYEEPALLHELCQKINGDYCDKILLSYKGQFIASAKRIRGVSKDVYEGLQLGMADPESWAHREPYLNGRKDSVNAPRFGYTLERMWSVIMQCSTNEIAWKCPSLLSRTRRGGDVGDCQCFDPPEPMMVFNATENT